MVSRVDPSQTVENVSWPSRTRSGTTVAQGPRTATKESAPPRETPVESLILTKEWERRLSDLDRQRQLEVLEAQRRSFDEGVRRGREDAAAETQKAFDQLARNLEELAHTKRKIRHEAEQELVQLSLAIARRILYRELSTDPASIEGIVHAALQKLQHREAARVRVYPAGAAAVRAALDRIGSRTGIEVVSDQGLATGALLFETSLGDLDASVETQLQEIQRGFADRLATR